MQTRLADVPGFALPVRAAESGVSPLPSPDLPVLDLNRWMKCRLLLSWMDTYAVQDQRLQAYRTLCPSPTVSLRANITTRAGSSQQLT